MMHDLVLITLNWLFKNLGRYSLAPLKRISHSNTLFLELSLSSQSLSTKYHIVNINLLCCDLVLLALMVSLLLFP